MMGFGILGFVALWAIFLAMPLQSRYDAEKVAIQDAKTKVSVTKQNEQLTAMLSPIRWVIDTQIEHLKTLADGQMSMKEAGLGASIGVTKVFCGHCPPEKDFYVFVVLRIDMLGRSDLDGTSALNYTTRK